MPENKGRYVRDFFLRSKFHFSPDDQSNVFDRRSDTEGEVASPNTSGRLVGGHGIEIENLTTLPYDIEVLSNLPDHPADGFSFLISNSTRADWTAAFKSVLDSPCGKYCPIVYGGNNLRQIRVRTVSIKYKQGIWTEWEEVHLHLILELTVVE